MIQDQAAAQRVYLAKLQEQADRQTQVLERLFGATVPLKAPSLFVAMHRMGNRDPRLVDKVVLEQFMKWLPAEKTRWVRCHRPASLEIVVTLVEDHLVAKAEEPGGGSQTPSKQAPVTAPRHLRLHRESGRRC